MTRRPLTWRLNVTPFIASKSICMIQHPSYLPDLAPADVFLFTKVKRILKRERFNDISDIQLGVTELLQGI
jgi:hypothetical protein